MVVRVSVSDASGADTCTAPPKVASASRALRAALLGFEPATLCASDAAALAEELASTEKACAAARVMTVSRAVALGVHKEKGFSDPATWLARQAGTTSRQAKDALSFASELDAHPLTKDAVVSGEVSIPQAEEILSLAEELPEAEAELLKLAKDADLTAVREEARERRLSSTPVDELHARQHKARRLRHWKDGLGMIRLDAALPPETGIPLVTRIEREAARHRAEARRDGDPEPLSAYAADALVFLAGGGGTGGGTKSPGRIDLVVVCDIYAWRRGHTHEGEVCHIVGGGPIPVELARQLAEDAFLKVVLHDGKDVQRVFHHGRRYTAELKTALDLGPVPAFSGRACVDCGRTWGLEYDHQDPIAHTGPTSMENVVDRCWPCHADKTERDRKAGLLGKKVRARAPARAAGRPPGSDGRARRDGSAERASPAGRDGSADRARPAGRDGPLKGDRPAANGAGPPGRIPP